MHFYADLRCIVAAVLTFSLNTAQALDFAWSGYGTLGYTRSNQTYPYQRVVTDRGTFARDTRFGVQLDTKFDPHWSATVQAQISPAADDDNLWTPKLTWAFISWRPNNDWLLRLGKLRLPGYLNSENMCVGWTFDYARLPVEMYSISPAVNFNGISVSKTWGLARGDLNLELFWGSADSAWRYNLRDGIPGILEPRVFFVPLRVEAKGMVLSYREQENLFRLGIYDASAERTDGQEWFKRVELVTPIPNVSYYNLSPGSGVPTMTKIDFTVVAFAVDLGLGQGFRLATEYGVRHAQDIQGGVSVAGGYAALRRQIGKWTPYLSYAQLRSEADELARYQNINRNRVPAWLPGAPLINASQRTAADLFLAYDQDTWAVGTSYALTPTSKLKLEWARTHIGAASSFVDAPAGGEVSDEDLNLFSLSYNFIF